MDLEMVLNELSLRSPANDILTAQQWMVDLIDTINVAAEHGVKKIIHVDRNINDVLLAPGYPIARWRNDSQVDRDTRSFFKTLTTKLSFIPDLPEFWYRDEQANGLGFAFQHEHIAISLKSMSDWNSGHLGLEVRYPELDENDQLIIEHVDIIHASCGDHILEHSEWIKNRTHIEIRDGSDIWNHKEELFLNLQFCDCTGVQIQSLLSGDPKFLYVKRKLLDLEGVCQDWQKQGGAFDLQKVPGKKKPESEATLNEYGQLRTFYCPDEEYRVFSLHVWVTRDWRIHFFPFGAKQQIIIGYIGVHLPTKAWFKCT
jgi:hypothetical protein